MNKKTEVKNTHEIHETQSKHSHITNLVGKHEHIAVELEPGLVTDITCELQAATGLSYTFGLALKKDYLEKAVETYVMGRYKSEQPIIDGFVKGKVPYMVIKKHYSNAFERSTNTQIKKLEEYVLVSHLQNALGLISRHYGLDFISEPRYITMSELSTEKDFTCTFKVDIEPEVPSVDLSTIHITQHEIDVSEEDIEKAVTDWCDKNYHGVDLLIHRPAQHGDIILADIVVKGSADTMHDVSIMIGAGKFVREFEEAFIGKAVGEEFVQALQIPENFSDKNVAGSTIQAKIVIKEIKASEKYKPDDSMARAFGVSSMGACREKISQQLHKEGEKLSEMLAKRSMLKQIADKLDIQLPETVLDNLIFQHVNLLAQRIKTRLEYPISDGQKEQINPIMQKEMGCDYDTWFSRVYPSITAEAKSRMFLLKYSKDHEIQVTKAELDQAIAERATTFPGGLKDAIEYFEKDNNARQRLINQIYEEKLLGDIYANVNKKHDKSSMQDLMKEFDKLGEEANKLMGVDSHTHSDDKKSKKISSDKHEHNHECDDEDCHADHGHKQTKKSSKDNSESNSHEDDSKSSKKKTGAASKVTK